MPPAADRHGFLRPSALDPRYLRFDDGTPYFAVGENLAWYDGRGTFAYDDWFEKLAAQGVNYVRLWMPSWAFGLSGPCARTARSSRAPRRLHGSPGPRLAARGPRRADRHGIQVMLCLQNHGPFSLDANSRGRTTLQRRERGPHGSLDFFDDPTSRELFKRRLRYVVARWGHATNLLAWELWNEVNLAASTFLPEVQSWHVEMARELQALDPWDHMITTSVSLGEERSALWLLPEITFTQTHTYNVPFLLDTGYLLTTL
jgi:hypothetical protein